MVLSGDSGCLVREAYAEPARRDWSLMPGPLLIVDEIRRGARLVCTYCGPPIPF